MERMKKWISKWALALLATVMMFASLVGCSSSDVDAALNVAIEVLDVVESLEAEEGSAEEEDASLPVLESSLEHETDGKPEHGVQETETAGAEEVKETTSAAEATEKETEKTTEKATESEEDGLTVEEDGHYTSKEEVALYIHTYGKLPSNFITKNEAEELGWKRKQGEAGQLHVVAPGMSIGGSPFGNYEGLLPEKKGRKYYECDINYVKGNRGAERIVYSNDGLVFYTGDHYDSFEQLYPQE